MTNEEAIKAIKCNYPPENYTRLREELDMAIEALENQMHSCEECRYAKHSPYNNTIYCRKLSRIMLSGNCCRDWTPLE